MTYTIYERGVGAMLSFEADSPDEAIEEAIEAIAVDPRVAPEIDCPANWLTFLRWGKGEELQEFQLVEEGHGEQPWE